MPLVTSSAAAAAEIEMKAGGKPTTFFIFFKLFNDYFNDNVGRDGIVKPLSQING